MYPFKSVTPFKPGDRVRYGAWKGKGRSPYVVVYVNRYALGLQREGKQEITLDSGQTVRLDVCKPDRRRIAISQSHALLTLLKSHELR